MKRIFIQKLLFFTSVLLLPFSIFGQKTLQIEGHVFFDENKNAIQNDFEINANKIAVIIQSTTHKQVVYSNKNGDWKAHVPVGNYHIFYNGFISNTKILYPVSNKNLSVGSIGVKNAVKSVLSANLNGHVYADTNGNGTQDGAETDLVNVNMIIIQSDGTPQAVITNVNGDWTASVPSGNTSIHLDNVDLPDDYLLTEGTDPTIIDALEGQNLYAGTDGIHYRGTLEGHLYNDINGDGIQNGSEDNLSNVSIECVDTYGNTQNIYTDANGNWTVLMAVTDITVSIDENDTDFPTGATQTEGNNPSVHAVIQATTTFTENDGFYPSGTLSGHLYNDKNGNGVEDEGDLPLGNIDVIITTSLGDIITVTTDANGNWEVVLPSGVSTINVDTTDPDFPIDAIQTEGINPSSVTVINGETVESESLGFYNRAELKGHIYLDLNQTGNQDTGDYDLANIPVKITDAEGIVYNVVSDSQGNWEVNVSSGSAESLIDVNDGGFPADAIQTEGTNPTTTVLTTGDSLLSDNDGFYTEIDQDGDGIIDFLEINNGTDLTDPCDPVQDINYTGYDPDNSVWADADCDGDGVDNGTEHLNNDNPYNPCIPVHNVGDTPPSPTNAIWEAADCDSDGVDNGTEVNENGTDPFSNIDTDGDGIPDDLEIENETNENDPCDPTQPVGYTGYDETNAIWQAADCDDDGVPNGDEHGSTDPYENIDTDGDGISDDLEIINNTDENDPCDPVQNTSYEGYDSNNTIWANSDCDGDGIVNGDEVNDGTNPNNPCDPYPSADYTGYDTSNDIWAEADCDGDGVLNGVEVADNTNPYDSCDPVQDAGYTGYDEDNIHWQEADCDGDGIINIDENEQDTDPYVSDGDILIYNAITPNGDGENDKLFIENITLFQPNTMQIYNRWGVLVYFGENYDNTTVFFEGYSEGRATLSKDKKLPSGTYYYIFDYTKNNKEEKKSGYIYIK